MGFNGCSSGFVHTLYIHYISVAFKSLIFIFYIFPELPVIRSELFYDSTKSEVVSGTELFSLPFKSKVACARVCVDTESCTHYFITAGRTRCALFSGNTSPGITGSGYLYTRIQ